MLTLWANGLLQAQVQGPSCTSVCGRSRQTLTNKIIGWADETQIALSVQWPLWIIEPVRRVCIRAVGLEYHRARTRGASGSPLTDNAAEICTNHWEIQQTTNKRVTRVLIRFEPKHLKGVADLILEIKHCQSGHVLQHYQLELLDEVHTQLLRLEGVQPESRRLWIYSGNYKYEADVIVQSNESVMPELTIPASDISAYLPEFSTKVAWRLLAGGHEFLLEQKTISLGNEAITINGTSLSLKDEQFFPIPGHYQLVCCVADIEVARFCFRIIDRCKWLQCLKLQRVDLKAETVSGRVALERGALIWGKHVAFSPRLQLTAPAPAPNETVACRAELRHLGTILQRWEFFVQFDQATKYIDLERFSLQRLGGSTQGKHIRLELNIYLENETNATWPIIVGPYNRISNFEGQLVSNARDFGVDEEAYREILSRLG